VQIHVSSFSFASGASMKLPPGESLTMQLVDEILTDGFVTAGDTLRICKLIALRPLPAAWQTRVGEAFLPEDSCGPEPVLVRLYEHAPLDMF
jgi:hypothetical protein